MKVSVAYANQDTRIWQTIDVDDDATVEDVIRQSGVLDIVPGINLHKQKVGIFGKFSRLDARVGEGDRIEIYNPITRVLDEEDEDDEDD